MIFWIILAVIVYMTIGAVVAGIINDNSIIGCVVFWPFMVIGIIVFKAAEVPFEIGVRIRKWLRYRNYRKGE